MKYIKEHQFYFILLLAVSSIYFGAAFLMLNDLFGFNQWQHFGFYGIVVLLLLILILVQIFLLFSLLRPQRHIKSTKIFKILNSPWLFIIVTALFFTLFLWLRNGFINSDGRQYLWLFKRDVPRYGWHFYSHDEALTLLIMSKIWYYGHIFWGWSVKWAYQFVSALSGAVFIFLLLIFSTKLFKNRVWLFFGAVIASGFMQLFFGDVENYALVSVFILAYLLSGFLFLKAKGSLTWPSLLLAVAICLHVLASMMAPSLMLLYLIALRRKGWRAVIINLLVFNGIIAGFYMLFNFLGLPIGQLFLRSDIFGSVDKSMPQMFAEPNWSYYAQLLNLLFLLLPAVFLLLPLALYRRLKLDLVNIFLLIAAVFFLPMIFSWKARLGVYNDWNLFAPAVIPAAIFIWYNFWRIKNLPYHTLIGMLFIVFFALQVYTWIVANHFFV